MDKWNNNMPEKEIEDLREELFMLLRRSLRPEFLNRVDEIVIFSPLNLEQIREIVVIQLNNLRNVLSGSNLKLDVSDEAIDWLATNGYDPQSGARPVKRLIQKALVNELSKEIIAGNIPRESTVTVDVEDDRLVFGNSSN
jgi:ATP-dependent Clp protease ATP-binding subunit ClpB